MLVSGEGTLKVDPEVLQTLGISFAQAGAGLANLQADAPLVDAAAAVPQLQTGSACQQAQSDVAAQTTAVADGAREFSSNLNTAAGWYQNRDQASADAIEKIDFPK